MTATVSIFSEPEFVMRIAVTAETVKEVNGNGRLGLRDNGDLGYYKG
jgi:hypothetical protein